MINNTLKYIAIQHELGMAIGLDLRLDAMLKQFTRVCVRRLGLASIHYYFLKNNKGNLLLPETIDNGSLLHHLSVPAQATAPSISPYETLVYSNEGMSVNLLPLNDSKSYSYLIPLSNLGCVILHRLKHPLEEAILELLKPVFARLTLSCQASIEHEQLLLAIEAKKKAEETILFQLLHDELTQLPNRRLLMQSLDRALHKCTLNEKLGALLFIDLDRFKVVNDTLGHQVGDKLLISVAKLLQNNSPAHALVSRLSGDEFVILIDDIANNMGNAHTNINFVLEKIQKAFAATIQAGEHLLHVTPSIGIEIFPDKISSADQILRHADTAMYQAKITGQNQFVYYDRHLSEELELRLQIEKELQIAIKSLDQFELVYQAQHTIDGICIGAEALIRWNSPYRDQVSPGLFIPVAEETGLMLELGQWVLQQACQDIKAIESGSLPPAFEKVCVNVSAMQFNQRDFVDNLMATVRKAGISPQRLCIELTESTLITNTSETAAKMHTLREFGIQTSVDDFGTGYSSLSYLSRFPIETLKIDQSFVRNIDTDKGNRAIVATIIALGQSLGLRLIAEGVETEKELSALADLGCTQYQGFYFTRPMSFQDFSARLLV